MQWRSMEECKYSSTIPVIGPKRETSGEIHATAALPPGNSPPVPIG
jgi:hypothetical protein